MRTNLDVLNVQQNVFSARRDLAQAYFHYLIAMLRLKAAVGTLTDAGPRGRPQPPSAAEPRCSRAAARRAAARATPTAGRRRRGARRGTRAPAARIALRRAGSPAARATVADERIGIGDAHARRPPRPRWRVASAKLNVCGPTSVGVPTAIGSIRFCPPSGSRLPPTNATSAAA